MKGIWLTSFDFNFSCNDHATAIFDDYGYDPKIDLECKVHQY